MSLCPESQTNFAAQETLAHEPKSRAIEPCQLSSLKLVHFSQRLKKSFENNQSHAWITKSCETLIWCVPTHEVRLFNVNEHTSDQKLRKESRARLPPESKSSYRNYTQCKSCISDTIVFLLNDTLFRFLQNSYHYGTLCRTSEGKAEKLSVVFSTKLEVKYSPPPEPRFSHDKGRIREFSSSWR